MTIDVRPLSSALGAEVHGIDLREPLDEATARAVNDAWVQHQVLLFRGQKIEVADQRRFVGIFGEIQPPRSRANERLHPDIMYVANVTVDGEKGDLPDGEMQFHADQCYYELPTKGAVLYALEIPSKGGDTLFASTYRAYETLPRELKERIAAREAVFTYDAYGNPYKRKALDLSKVPHFVHPIVIAHPATGRPALFVNRLMTDSIVGMSRGERAAAGTAVPASRAARQRLRARMAGRRRADLGQSLDRPRPHRFRSQGAPRASAHRDPRRSPAGLCGRRSRRAGELKLANTLLNDRSTYLRSGSERLRKAGIEPIAAARRSPAHLREFLPVEMKSWAEQVKAPAGSWTTARLSREPGPPGRMLGAGAGNSVRTGVDDRRPTPRQRRGDRHPQYRADGRGGSALHLKPSSSSRNCSRAGLDRAAKRRGARCGQGVLVGAAAGPHRAPRRFAARSRPAPRTIA